MKLHICINKASIPGYLHIDPAPKNNVPAFQGTMGDLSQLASKGECTEILAPEILDYIMSSQIDESLQQFVSLLHHEGKLIVGGTEFYELCRGVFNGQVTSEQFNQIIFHPQFRRNGLYMMTEIKDKLVDLGLEIEAIKINNGAFIIHARRN